MLLTSLSDYSIHEKQRRTTTEATKHHTLRPPKKMFPGDGSDTGIVLQPEDPAQNEILISRPDLPGYKSAGNKGFEIPHKTGKHQTGSFQGLRTDIKEALSIKCSGTFVTVCTFWSPYIVWLL